MDTKDLMFALHIGTGIIIGMSENRKRIRLTYLLHKSRSTKHVYA